LHPVLAQYPRRWQEMHRIIDSSEPMEKVRREKPLIHHITNLFTINDCANIVKAFGASPVMAHAREEVADMAGISSALVLNIGTLTSEIVGGHVARRKKC